MSVIGHGVDICVVERIRGAVGEPGSHFEKRVFTPQEIEYCRKKGDPFPHFAARYAAKEAFAKAVGLGLGAMGNLTDVEVSHGPNGNPLLIVSGRAQKTLESMGNPKVWLSLSHDGSWALASIVLSQ